MDPVRRLLDDAAGGRYPPPDGSVTILPPDRTTSLHAVLSFTAHAVVLTDLDHENVRSTGIDAYGGATDPSVLLALAGDTRRCGVLDLALVRPGTGTAGGDATEDGTGTEHRTEGGTGTGIENRTEGGTEAGIANRTEATMGATTARPTDRFDDHHRVRYARELRRDVTVYADDTGLFALGRGLGGRWELGFELTGVEPGTGHGAALVRQAIATVPAGESLFAACAPGNARSLRVLLAAGFVPFGSEVILPPMR